MTKKSKGLWFVHHFVRAIWAQIIFKEIAFLVYLFRWIFNIKGSRKIAKVRLETLRNYRTVGEITGWFKNEEKDPLKYNYKWDGFEEITQEKIDKAKGLWKWILKLLFKIKGILDRDNSWLEFLIACDDCDGAARFSMKLIKRLNKKYKLGISKVFRIGIMGTRFQSWHYDCFYKVGDTFCLVNYGYILKGNSIEACLKQLPNYFTYKDKNGKWVNDYPFDKVKYWICSY